MYRLILRRLLLLPLIVAVVSFLIFLTPLISGIDPATAVLQAQVLDRQPTPEAVERLKSELGLERPLLVQYAGWLWRVAQGDMGRSFMGRVPVSERVFDGLKVSAVLSVVTLAISLGIALPVGIVAAMKPGTLLDTLVSVVSQTGVVVPSYLLGPALILVFGVQLGWLPSAGWRGPEYLVLPALTLAAAPTAFFAHVVRASMLEALSMEYMRTARAKGLGEGVLVRRHALRNALIPVVTVSSMWLAGLIGGALIVEVIFSVPGIGRVLFDAINASDLPLIQASLMMIVVFAVVINTATDVIYVVLNPAIRLQGAGR
ncbi:MAG: ABC transporter permease [Dehalococcoidia bacterium]|nr:ABC transporter permease [Dehalococcoidia bacterium]